MTPQRVRHRVGSAHGPAHSKSLPASAGNSSHRSSRRRSPSSCEQECRGHSNALVRQLRGPLIPLHLTGPHSHCIYSPPSSLNDRPLPVPPDYRHLPQPLSTLQELLLPLGKQVEADCRPAAEDDDDRGGVCRRLGAGRGERNARQGGAQDGRLVERRKGDGAGGLNEEGVVVCVTRISCQL